MNRGLSVVVDGSLRNHAFYVHYVALLRHRFPGYRFGLVWVDPEPQIVQRRLQSRKRQVPSRIVDLAARQVPQSVARLRPLMDWFVHWKH
jgi:predicted kinase